MKTSALLIAAGLVSSAALAQMQAPMPSSDNADSGSTSSMPSGASSDGSQRPAAVGTSPDIVARLQPKSANGASYICGGVGAEEAGYLKQQARNHDLLMQFATQRGEFLADVNVQIADARGNQILQARCDGPMMLVDLPRSGSYRVHADAAGYTLDRTVSVTHGQKGRKVSSLVMTWPQRVAQAGASAETQTGGSQTGGAGASGEDRRHGK